MQQNLKQPASGPETLAEALDEITPEVERVVQIEMFIAELRSGGPFPEMPFDRVEAMGKSWQGAICEVPTDEIARRDDKSLLAELMRREKYTAGAVAELWAARQGNAARAQIERDKAQAREDEFAQPQKVGPGHAALMAIGAALGWRAEVTV